MKKRWKEEKSYLAGIYKGILNEKNLFHIPISKMDYVSVISNGIDSEFMKDIDKYSKYQALYNTAIDSARKIEYSLDCAIKNAYKKKVQNKFNILFCSNKNEWLAYYYIENAISRVESLWDTLAHFYNVKYNLNITIDKVYHNRIFSMKENWINKYWKNNPPEDVFKVMEYIDEEDDINIDDQMWKGNYRFINSLRNDMAHRITIAQSSISTFCGFKLKHSPTFILRRLCECFAVLENFINDVCQSIINDMKSKYDGEEKWQN